MYLCDVYLASCTFDMIHDLVRGREGGVRFQGNSWPNQASFLRSLTGDVDPTILERLWLLFYRPFLTARPVVLSFRWTFAPSYDCVFHCLASCLRPIGFPTGGINKDNPISDSISSPASASLLARKYVKTTTCFSFFFPSFLWKKRHRRNHSQKLGKDWFLWAACASGVKSVAATLRQKLFHRLGVADKTEMWISGWTAPSRLVVKFG